MSIPELQVASASGKEGPWFNTREAASYLRMTANALRIAICRGEVPVYRWRRRLYFKKIELDRMLERSRLGRW